MYLKHFKLSKMPFENVCDTDFFFESGNHKEAYSRLAYAIEEKKPCAALTGGYGTGKTFVLKAVERDLRRKGYLFSSVNNPRLDDLGLLRIILHGFTGYEVPARKEDVLMGIEKFLKDTNRDGKHVVVAVDEAQDIDDQKVFEELRLLLNYQTESRSLLTLVLSGQTELSERLHSNKQFSQRIFLSYDLKPLDRDSTVSYMKHRLEKAGANRELFDKDACGLVYERSGGIPRWINNIGNMALLAAFSRQADIVDVAAVNEAIESARQ